MYNFTYSGNVFHIALTVQENGRINSIVPDFPTWNIKVGLPWAFSYISVIIFFKRFV